MEQTKVATAAHSASQPANATAHSRTTTSPGNGQSPASSAAAAGVVSMVQRMSATGNEYLRKRAYGKAVRCYTQALSVLLQQQRNRSADAEASVLGELEATLRSNRSAAYYNLQKHVKALEDADACVALRGSWFKAHQRRGQVLLHLRRFEEAAEALEQALMHAERVWKEDMVREGYPIEEMLAEQQRRAEAEEKGELDAFQPNAALPAMPPLPPHFAKLTALADFAHACVELEAMTYVLPPEPMLDMLKGVPAFTVVGANGAPFYIAYDGGNGMYPLYLDVRDAQEMLQWVRENEETANERARIVSLDVPQVLKIVRNEQAALLAEVVRRGLEEGPEAGLEAYSQPRTLNQLRPSLVSVQTAIEIMKSYDQQQQPELPANAEAASSDAKAPSAEVAHEAATGETSAPPPAMDAEAASSDAKAPAAETTTETPPPLAPVDASAAAHSDEAPPNEHEELTPDNFNGIPVFQAKGLTLLRDKRQYMPLFFDKDDLDFAWTELRKAAEAAIASGKPVEMPVTEHNVGEPLPLEQVPETCDIDVGTLDDVLRRMAEAADENSDEFSSILFVPPRRSMDFLGLPFPLDDLNKSEEEVPQEKKEQGQGAAPATQALTAEQLRTLLNQLTVRRMLEKAAAATRRGGGHNAGRAANARTPAPTSSRPLTARELARRGGDRETIREFLEAELAKRRAEQKPPGAAEADRRDQHDTPA